MTQRTDSLQTLAFATLAVAIAVFAPTPLRGAEVAATHLVFEKAVKMKKAEAVLYMPFFDQARKSDSAERPREIECLAFADGKKGPLPVRGTFRLRLVGEAGPSNLLWESKAIASPIEAGGEASFDSDSVLGLVAEAADADAELDLIRIEFDGGRGKKVATLTVDCIHREAK